MVRYAPRSVMVGGLCALVALAAAPALAARITLKDGRVLVGRIAPVPGTVEQLRAVAPEGVLDNRPVLLIDDGLRRIFIPRSQVVEVLEGDGGDPPERFLLKQNVATAGARIGTVGPIVRTTEFDEFGRRTQEMKVGTGVISIVEGITEITPEWVRIEGLDVEGPNYIWDQRMSIHALDRALLAKILARHINPKKLDDRLKVVRLYLQAERYADAEAELKQVLADFPTEEARFLPTVQGLRQAHARRILEEIEFRRAAGQHGLARAMLEAFPAENVAGETLAAVARQLEQYRAELARGATLLERLDAHIEAIADPSLRTRLKPVRDEIAAQLNLNTLSRLDAYQQFLDADDLPVEDKVSLAASGWLVGSGEATRRLPVALSLWHTRELVRQYLVEESRPARQRILIELRSEEGATPPLVDRLLENLTPPRAAELPEPVAPLTYLLSVDTLRDQPPAAYWVVLPPEYDPHRRYPAIVTLHGQFTSPQQQLDWWAGTVDAQGNRLGHAGRHGYIVIAPAWARPEQRSYEYSAVEQAAVLHALRDAQQRFSIDTDRVFLTGHSMGGDAVWDLGLAHPDLWAAMIPLGAISDKYVAHLWENGRYVPFYLVAGEKDGDKVQRNSRELDRALRRGFNATVVHYQGRGHDSFSDEATRLFDWMGRLRREFFPREFEVRAMRSWDTTFWWLELADLPARSVVDPAQWPGPRGTFPVQTTAQVNAANGLVVQSGAARVTVWIAPELVDFNQPARVNVKGARLRTEGPYLEPSLAVMLEDARTRGDRQHPFWCKVEMPEGRINAVD